MAKKTEFQERIKSFEKSIVKEIVQDREFNFTDSEIDSVTDFANGLTKLAELMEAKKEMDRMKNWLTF